MDNGQCTRQFKGAILVEGSSVVSDPGCVAEVFSDYFANIIQLEHRSDTVYTDHPSIKAISNLRFSSEFNYSPVSTSYIRNILDHLNPRKAVGVDSIPRFWKTPLDISRFGLFVSWQLVKIDIEQITRFQKFGGISFRYS